MVSINVFVGLNKALLRPYSAPGRGQTVMRWGIYPAGLKKKVLKIKENCGNPFMYLNENGSMKDWDRIRFLETHLQALHEAIREGANVWAALCGVCPTTLIGNGVTANNSLLCGLILKRSSAPPNKALSGSAR